MANHRAIGRAQMRPLTTAQGSRRRSDVSTGAVKTGMIGVLATATIAVPLAAAYADGAAEAPAQAAAPADVAPSQPVTAPAVALPAAPEVRPAENAASRSTEREEAPSEETPAEETDPAAAGSLTAEAPAPEPAAELAAVDTAAPAAVGTAAPAAADTADADDSSIEMTGGSVRPVDGPITSSYGYRVHPVLGYSKMHDGVDFGASCGAPVKAAKAGVVVETSYHHASGNRVKIDHGNGQISGYYHLQGFSVSQGQTVNAGEVVGTVGSTGRSTGCHLHLALEDASGTYSNPMSLFQ